MVVTPTLLLSAIGFVELGILVSIFARMRKRKALEHFFGKEVRRRTNLLALL